MPKMISDPIAFQTLVLEGILVARPARLRAAGDQRAIVRADAPVMGKVAIPGGGGPGHLPVAVGDVSVFPSIDTMLAVTRAINGGRWLAERSQGHPDAGATLIAMALRAAANLEVN